MTTTPDDQKPKHSPDVDGLQKRPAGSDKTPTPENEAKAMEEAQKEGAEQREEGGYS